MTEGKEISFVNNFSLQVYVNENLNSICLKLSNGFYILYTIKTWSFSFVGGDNLLLQHMINVGKVQQMYLAQ